MFCMKCGKKIDDDSTFCPYCGNKIGTYATATETPVSLDSNIKNASNMMINKRIVIGLSVCLVAVLLIFGIIKLFSGGSSNEDTALIETNSVNIDGSYYKPGVYTTTLVLNDDTADIEVIIADGYFQSIRLFGLSEEMASNYPYLQSTFNDIANQLIVNQSLDGITYPDDAKYTAMIIMDAIESALQKPAVTSDNSKGISLKDNPPEWASAYEDYMTDKSGAIVLVDLDNDGTPELIGDKISSGSVQVFSADNKQYQMCEVYNHNVFIAKYTNNGVVDCTLDLDEMTYGLQVFKGDNDNQIVLAYNKFVPTGLAANNFAIDGYTVSYLQVVDISDSKIEAGYACSDSNETAYSSISHEFNDVFNENYRAGSIEKAIEIYNEK